MSHIPTNSPGGPRTLEMPDARVALLELDPAGAQLFGDHLLRAQDVPGRATSTAGAADDTREPIPTRPSAPPESPRPAPEEPADNPPKTSAEESRDASDDDRDTSVDDETPPVVDQEKDAADSSDSDRPDETETETESEADVNGQHESAKANGQAAGGMETLGSSEESGEALTTGQGEDAGDALTAGQGEDAGDAPKIYGTSGENGKRNTAAREATDVVPRSEVTDGPERPTVAPPVAVQEAAEEDGKPATMEAKVSGGAVTPEAGVSSGEASSQSAGTDAETLRGHPVASEASSAESTVTELKGDRQRTKRRDKEGGESATKPTSKSQSPSSAQPNPASRAMPAPPPETLQTPADLPNPNGDGHAEASPAGGSTADNSAALLGRLGATAERKAGQTTQSQGSMPEGEVDPARFVRRVARAFRALGSRGGPVRLRLSPPELGSLRMEVTVRNGMMTARLEAETPMARSLLLDQLPALRDRLAQQDIKIEQFEVDLMGRSPGGLPEQSTQQRPQQQAQGQQASRGDAPASDDEETTANGATTARGDGSQLNVVV